MSKLLTLADFSHLAARDLPDTPDGRYPYQVQPKVTGGMDGASEALHSKFTLFVDSIKSLRKQGPILKDPEQALKAFIQAVKSPNAIDDRQGLFCTALAVLCKVPESSPLAQEANNKVIELLYNSLPHPPATYLAPFPAQSPPQEHNGGRFRSADGGGNNVWMPALGRAGMPYARDVENDHPLPANALPDPGLVFDTLLRAKPGNFKPHPGGNSSLTFAFASLVTHSLFRTNPRNWNINDTNSYLDLSVLYGVSQQQQDMIRNKEEGRGYLWKDAFAEDRLVLVPPAASALLVIFSRNHNYIADTILRINERGTWKNPPPADAKLRAKQDEEIFQTARLINCGHFMAMIFGDYVAGFLGLARDGSGWSMNPFDPIKTSDGEFLGRGEGNHVSVEFNLLYRWHATTAQKDIQWTEDLFAKVFGTAKPFEDLTLADFGPAVLNAWSTLVDANPRTRTFAGLKRGPDGAFSDDDIARVLLDATESPAAAYRAQGTPSVLRIIEIMGIVQGRSWGVCSMNEFRAFLGLKKFDTFEEWSSNKEVASAARQLYGHIDNLELYPGLQAEDCMPLGPGSGICCGYTMTRAILGDAVALVRGDRFYTTDYTPSNLTSWGFQDCARDPNNGSFGSALPKLLLRHLPRHYTSSSVYGLYPFFTPTVNKTNLKHLGIDDEYTFERPGAKPVPVVVNTMEGVKYILSEETKFKQVCGDEGIVLSGDGSKRKNDIQVAAKALFSDKASITDHATAFQRWTEDLILENSFSLGGLPGRRVDIVGNVTNLLGVRWVADYLMGMPLKTVSNPRGLFTSQETYDMLSKLYDCVYNNDSPEGRWQRCQEAGQLVAVWRQIIKQNVKESAGKGVPLNPIPAVSAIVSSVFWPGETKDRYRKTLATLAKFGRTSQDLLSTILHLAISVSVPLAKVVAQVIDFYLDDSRATERAQIVSLASTSDGDVEANALLLGYVREAQRLRPFNSSVLRTATTADVVPEHESSISVKPGDVVFVSLANANLDPTAFSDPLKIDPRRPSSAYRVNSSGFPNALEQCFFEQVVPSVVRSVFKLKNIRRAEGVAGSLAGYTADVNGTPTPFYLDKCGNVTNWPTSLTVIYG